MPDGYQKQIFEEENWVAENVLKNKRVERRRILIVGGAGYIGTVLIEHLLQRGYDVVCLDMLLYDNGRCVEPYIGQRGFDFMAGDFVDSETLKKSLHNITDVVLLAGLVGDPITKKYPQASAIINQSGYENLLSHIAGIELNKVIFVSTCSNYGLMTGDQLATEESALNPLSAYAEAKVSIEKLFLGQASEANYAPVVLRFATAFGLSPRMRFDLTISQFTREIALGQDLLVYDPDTWRPYCHVQDFSEVIRRVIEAPRDLVAGQVFNAGGDENNYTKRMIVDAVRKQSMAGSVSYQKHGSDPRNYRVNFGKIRDALHFVPGHSVEDGISELLAALDQGQFADIASRHSFHGNYEISYQA